MTDKAIEAAADALFNANLPAITADWLAPKVVNAARPIILNEIAEMLEDRAHELSADKDDRLAAELYQWARKLGSDDD